MLGDVGVKEFMASKHARVILERKAISYVFKILGCLVSDRHITDHCGVPDD